jgi:uncharacterized RDD family membrane protein YckC
MSIDRPQDRTLVLRRIAARAVDAFTIFFLTFGLAVTVLFAFMAELTDMLALDPWGRSLAPALLFFVVAVVYEATFVSRRGQTPGKDLLDVRVIDALDPEGSRIPTPSVAAARALVAWSVVFVPDLRLAFALAAAGALLLLLAPVRLAVLDRIVTTAVVAYDADLEEGPVDDRVPADDLEHRYGPRLWRSLTGTKP